MIKFENHLGAIEISQDYFVNLVGNAVMNSFGVAAMASSSPRKGFWERLTRQDPADKGINVRIKNQKLLIDLHIIVTYGTNISAIVKSIMHNVRFTVEDKTGLGVARVNVFVDGMRTE